MMLQPEVVQYLLRRNLLSKQCLVAGDLQVVDVSRRNRNFKVISEHGPSYLVKLGIDAERIATLANEAATYRFLLSNSRTSNTRDYLPRFYGYDKKKPALILEFVRRSINLRDHHLRVGRSSVSLAAAVGTALATLHRELWRGTKSGHDRPAVPVCAPPWILSFHRPAPTMIWSISNANVQIIRILQEFPDFCELLDRLREEWRTDTLIHFDIKWDNCLIATDAARTRRRLKIIDWELSGWGDPSWDVGSVFADYLRVWLFSIPITGESTLNGLPALARYPLIKMQPAMWAFWRSYSQRMRFDSVDARNCLLRGVRYAAARLVQTTFEQAQRSAELTGNAICALQLGLNMLRRPHEASIKLLSIPVSGS